MKQLLSINRSGRADQSAPVVSPAGVEITPRGMGVADYEVFLVAKGLNTYGVGTLISPDDYFTPDKSVDVYALLCARPEPASVGESQVNVYPVFFIARLDGMSRPFSNEEAGDCRTLCLDVIQRVGAGENLAPMQRRVFMNLRVNDPHTAEPVGIIFRPSWDKYISFPEDGLAYEQVAYSTEWSALPGDPGVEYRVLNKNGETWLGPYTVLFSPTMPSEFQLRTSDIHMANNWAIWCGRGVDTGDPSSPQTYEWAVSLSSPILALIDEATDARNLVWLCLHSQGPNTPDLVPIAYEPAKGQWSNSMSGLMIVYSPATLYL